MTQQEIVDREIRLLLGDLQLQLVFAKARIAELEGATPKPNGSGRHIDHSEDSPQPPAAN